MRELAMLMCNEPRLLALQKVIPRVKRLSKLAAATMASPAELLELRIASKKSRESAMLSSRIAAAEQELKNIQQEIAASCIGAARGSSEIVELLMPGTSLNELTPVSPISVLKGVGDDACDFLAHQVVPPVTTVRAFWLFTFLQESADCLQHHRSESSRSLSATQCSTLLWSWP